MDALEIRRIVEAERLSLCDVLDGLDTGQWSTPSLCEGWTVHEVVAHLTLPTRTSFLAMVMGMARAGGDFDRMADRSARRRAARFEPPALIAQLRETAGSARRMPGSSPVDPLIDILVHAQDICRPLAIQHRMPAPGALLALAYVSTSTFHGAPARLDGLRLTATDSAWTHGPQGRPAVDGTTQDLLLTATGRPAGLDGLHGDGVETLRSRLGTATGTSSVGESGGAIDGRR